jgi:hypothetical protein
MRRLSTDSTKRKDFFVENISNSFIRGGVVGFSKVANKGAEKQDLYCL